MVWPDLKAYEPHLRKIKFHSLDPEIMQDILEVAGDFGFEVTITSESNLDFLFRIYHAEKKKREADQEKLGKAEDLILKLAGIYTLRHGGTRPQEKKEEKRFRGELAGGRITVSEKARELLRSVGITSERQMVLTVEQIGEKKIEERVARVRETSLGQDIISELFSENPDRLRIPEDHLFIGELRAIEHKRDFLEAWSKTSGKEPPLWADYTFSPSVLLADYQQIMGGLGIELGQALAQEPQGEYPHMDADELHRIFLRHGFSMSREDGGVVFEHPEGKIITLSAPEDGLYDPLAVGKIIANLGDDFQPECLGEKTVPAVPGARKRPSSAPNPASEQGLRELLSIFSERGIDVSRLGSSYDIISSDPESGSDSNDRERFESTILLLSDLIFAHGLEKKISTNLGQEGLRIIGVRYLSGASGAFELHMKSKTGSQRIYLSMQDMGPAKIGREIIEASGMVSCRIWTSTPSGKYVTSQGRSYAVSEDARDIGKRGRLRLRMPDFTFEEVETLGAAMFREDIAIRPDLSNPLHREFYEKIADESGRKKILRSILAYFEMSRRALLPDRRPPNTCLLMVRRGNGDIEFTFQPTDLDGIGNFIGTDGKNPDFREFHKDFHKAAVYFAIQIHEGMLRAGLGGVPPVRQLLSEMAELSLEPFPDDDSETSALRERAFRRHDGELIGIGFDASQHVGSTIPSQGRRKEIMRDDGRVLLEADAAIHTAAIAANLQAECWGGLRADLEERLRKLPKSIAQIAVSIARARMMEGETGEQANLKEDRLRQLRSRTGGELASRIASMPEFAETEGETALLNFAQMAAAKELLPELR